MMHSFPTKIKEVFSREKEGKNDLFRNKVS